MKHFFISLLTGFLFTSFLYVLLIPLTYWMLFGEGETGSNIMDRPINSFILEYGALIIILGIYGVLIFLTYRGNKIPKMKSYVLSGIIVSIMYIFRLEIGNFIIELF